MSYYGYDSREDYLDACKQQDIDNGMDSEKAEHRRQMYEANGEEWKGQYGGDYGF